MTIIESIGTALPDYRHSQEQLCCFLENHLPMEESTGQLMRRMATNSAIDARFSVLPDFSLPAEQWPNIKKTENQFNLGSLEERMEVYFREVLPLSLKAIENLSGKPELNEITHLIAVTCTGLAAPGLDLMLMEALALNKNTERSAVQFMGCYAAIHALKQADYICRAQPSARVLLVCTELCTLHIQADARPDNLASTLLFGDGSAAVLLSNEQQQRNPALFRLKSFASAIHTGDKKQMAWNLSGQGFLMELGMYVPELLGNGIDALLQQALGSESEDISGWAIHPGGRKILDKVASGLQIPKEALSSGYEVLRQFGNMSSPTVLFVLKEEHKKMKRENRRGNVFSAAFGPGLTMESLLLEYVD